MRTLLSDAGFVDVAIDVKSQSKEIIGAWMPGSSAEDFVASAYVTALKPADVPHTTNAAPAPGEDLFIQRPAPAAPDVKVTAAPQTAAAGC
mmetsp:Transcript_33566/g.107251  ORF Transcript_33566/g.107251 Transcript_33566/m.107251 type:complete len:91 (-) Transcript_33566:408-680(-)